MPSAEVAGRIKQIVENIEKVIVGKREAIELAVAALLANGHVLIDDIPGVGKTSLARSLALSVRGDFKRIQFTPDILPSDLTGVSIWDQSRQDFTFKPGPVFANIILADEINRATPKSQAALLECMEERQVSVDGVSYPVPVPFMVIATENPIEYEGTYALPEAELDRFMLRMKLGYPRPAEEVEVITRQQRQHPIESVEAVVDTQEVAELQRLVREVYLEDSLKEYVVRLTNATRNHPEVELGASPRGSITLMRLSQALAALAARDYVIPEDIRTVAVPALAHRLSLSPDRQLRGTSPEAIVEEILEANPAPLGRRKTEA
ncbi:MAG: MoxR family ATPase [candidate division WS1 bacterium]|nr:MoxR family ATPase [candidate division WS1 bacterium]